MKEATKLVSLGRNAKRDCGSVNPPVHRTSTVLFDNFAQMRDYEAGRNDHPGYARHGTPTIRALEEAICELEGGDYCCITASGQSATVLAIIAFAKAGDHFLISDSIYASTRFFVEREAERLGLEYTFYNPTSTAEELEAMIKPNTVFIYVESPGSLTFEMQDVPAIAKMAHANDLLVISDSTWATPLGQDAFGLGIDVSIQSVTKYIAAHSDLMMGAITVKEPHAKRLKTAHHLYAMIPGADNAYLALRGLRSMAVRMPQHEASTLKVAKHLQTKSCIERVLYPALPEDPGHALWKRDLTLACGLFGILLKDGSENKVAAFIDSLHHFGLGYSWGGYESLVTGYQPNTIRSASNWSEDDWIIRLHIGLENVDDLLEDLDQAVSAMESVS
ncbi:MAG: cystathionine beta-lyase [Rickettsiales bacterium]|nr:cystathionine beta-lyase [Rickettsiales bacterium]